MGFRGLNIAEAFSPFFILREMKILIKIFLWARFWKFFRMELDAVIFVAVKKFIKVSIFMHRWTV